MNQKYAIKASLLFKIFRQISQCGNFVHLAVDQHHQFFICLEHNFFFDPLKLNWIENYVSEKTNLKQTKKSTNLLFIKKFYRNKHDLN